MTSRFQQRCIDRLNSRAADVAEEPITYSDGTHTLSIGAIPGPADKPPFQILGMTQSMTTGLQGSAANQDRTFSILASVLKVSGVRFKPKHGHTITATLGGVAGIYEVSTPQGSAYPYEMKDNEARVLVHTKFLRAA